MKRALSLLLALLLVAGCLTGCSLLPANQTKPVENKFAADGEAPETTPEEPPQDSAEAGEPDTPAEANTTELFYSYLSETVIPEVGLASLGNVTVDMDGFEKEHPALLENEGFLGLVSASVRDFDGDGTDEMVTFTLVNSDVFYTWMREFIREDMWLLTVAGIQLDLYAIENGEVVHKDTDKSITWIDGLSWGPMAAGLEQYEGKIYIWAKAHSENTSTYGTSPFCISHVENGKFVRDYVDGMSWGQEDLTEEFREVATTHMLIGGTPLGDVANAVDMFPQNSGKWPETFGKRLALNVWLEGDWDNWGMLRAEAEDFTNLRYILETGDYAIIPLPTEPLPQAGGESGMAEKAKTLADTLLPGLTGSANNWEDEYGYFHSEVSLFSGNTLSLTFDAAGDVTQIILNCSDTEIWYNEKDLILQSSALGLDPDAIAPMLGKCSMTQFSGGIDVGGYTVTIVEVVAPVLNIRPNS